MLDRATLAANFRAVEALIAADLDFFEFGVREHRRYGVENGRLYFWEDKYDIKISSWTRTSSGRGGSYGNWNNWDGWGEDEWREYTRGGKGGASKNTVATDKPSTSATTASSAAKDEPSMTKEDWLEALGSGYLPDMGEWDAMGYADRRTLVEAMNELKLTGVVNDQLMDAAKTAEA